MNGPWLVRRQRFKAIPGKVGIACQRYRLRLIGSIGDGRIVDFAALQLVVAVGAVSRMKWVRSHSGIAG